MDGFTPRIVVPNDEDAELVFAALVDFQIKMASLTVVNGIVDLDVLKHARRACDMAMAMGEEMQTAAVRKMVDVPDDLSGLDDENQG